MFGSRFFGPGFFGPRFWGRRSTTGPAPSAPNRVLAAVATLIEESVPELVGSTFVDSFNPNCELPRALISSLGSSVESRSKTAKVEAQRFQIAIWDDDESRIEELAEAVDAALDDGELILEPGPRDQKFLQMSAIDGTVSLIESKRETQGQLVYGRVQEFIVRVDVGIAASQRRA